MVRCGERVELLPVKRFSGRSLQVWRLPGTDGECELTLVVGLHLLCDPTVSPWMDGRARIHSIRPIRVLKCSFV